LPQEGGETKAGQLVNHRADLQNLRTSHTSQREELTKQLPQKDVKEMASLSKDLVRLRHSFCLNINTKTG
jgi:hypothetical protein